MAGLTGLEPATSGVTGRRCNRLYYSPATRKKKETEIGQGGMWKRYFLFPFQVFPTSRQLLPAASGLIYWTASFRALPALNLGDLEAAMLIFAPV